MDNLIQTIRAVGVSNESAALLAFHLSRSAKQGSPLPHLLFIKADQFAAREVVSLLQEIRNSDLQTIDANQVSTPRDVLPYLTNAANQSFILVEQIQKLSTSPANFLLRPLRDFCCDITLGDGLNARTINMQLQPFTCVATCDSAEQLPTALRRTFTAVNFGMPSNELLLEHTAKLFPRESTSLLAAILEVCRPRLSDAEQLVKQVLQYGHAVRGGRLSRTSIAEAVEVLQIGYLCGKRDADEEGGTVPSRHIPQNVRAIVYRRDGGKCKHCGSRENLEYDHMVPFSRGGNNHENNIELLCRTCNRKKHDKIALDDSPSLFPDLGE
jgi:Holliday junction resolvasome RuvABC ATP-dependent DNA helicase subunit